MKANGEACDTLARVMFFNRLGEIRDRSFEQHRYRTSGLNPVTAAVDLRNTVYLERAAHALHGNGHAVVMRCCSTCRRWAGSTSI